MRDLDMAGAERDADSDLLRAALDSIGDDAVEPDAGEYEREQSEGRGEHGDQALLPDGGAEKFSYRAYALQSQTGRGFTNCLARGGSERGRVAGGAQNGCQQRDSVLRHRLIHHGDKRLAWAETDVVH